jgi:hypothetical protein
VFSQLPNIIDRNFAIGYLLPTAALVIIIPSLINRLINGLGFTLDLPTFLTSENPLVGTTVVALVSWFFAILFLVLNRSIYQIMEGYGGILNPVSWLGFVEKYHHDRLVERLTELGKQYWRVRDRCGEQARALSRIDRQRAELLQLKAEEFPSEESRLLPTRFGNAIRAFEDYSRVVYGFEDIQGWDRLLTVIPTDFRQLIDDAKAQTDFWLNLWAVGCLIIMVYMGSVAWILTFGTSIIDKEYGGHWQSLLWSSTLWYLVLAIVLVRIARRMAKRAAVEWGNVVKAAYDTFLPELGQNLGFRAEVVHEKDPWVRLSRLIVYHNLDDREYLVQHYLSAPAQNPADTEVQKQGTHEHEELLKAQEDARYLRAELDAKQNKGLLKKLLGR